MPLQRRLERFLGTHDIEKSLGPACGSISELLARSLRAVKHTLSAINNDGGRSLNLEIEHQACLKANYLTIQAAWWIKSPLFDCHLYRMGYVRIGGFENARRTDPTVPVNDDLGYTDARDCFVGRFLGIRGQNCDIRQSTNDNRRCFGQRKFLGTDNRLRHTAKEHGTKTNGDGRANPIAAEGRYCSHAGPSSQSCTGFAHGSLDSTDCMSPHPANIHNRRRSARHMRRAGQTLDTDRRSRHLCAQGQIPSTKRALHIPRTNRSVTVRIILTPRLERVYALRRCLSTPSWVLLWLPVISRGQTLIRREFDVGSSHLSREI